MVEFVKNCCLSQVQPLVQIVGDEQRHEAGGLPVGVRYSRDCTCPGTAKIAMKVLHQLWKDG